MNCDSGFFYHYFLRNVFPRRKQICNNLICRILLVRRKKIKKKEGGCKSMKLVWKCWWCESLPGENCTVLHHEFFNTLFGNQSYRCCDCPGTPRTSEILSFLKRQRLHSQFDWTLVCLLGNSDLLRRCEHKANREQTLFRQKNRCLRLLQVQGIDKNTTSTACAVCCPASP